MKDVSSLIYMFLDVSNFINAVKITNKFHYLGKLKKSLHGSDPRNGYKALKKLITNNLNPAKGRLIFIFGTLALQVKKN